MPSASASSPPRRPRPLRLKIHSALRWLHIYVSMVTLLLVLFFSVTGITLNHPAWTFGTAETRTETEGALPANWKNARGIDWLTVAEYLRKQHHLHGAAGDQQEDSNGGSLSFKAPGYSADAFIDGNAGTYKLTISAQGIVSVLNDLHRGRDSGTSWAWAIDIAGVLLVVISLTGIGLLLYLKNARVSALMTMVAGIVIVLVLMRLAA